MSWVARTNRGLSKLSIMPKRATSAAPLRGQPRLDYILSRWAYTWLAHAHIGTRNAREYFYSFGYPVAWFAGHDPNYGSRLGEVNSVRIERACHGMSYISDISSMKHGAQTVSSERTRVHVVVVPDIIRDRQPHSI